MWAGIFIFSMQRPDIFNLSDGEIQLAWQRHRQLRLSAREERRRGGPRTGAP